MTTSTLRDLCKAEAAVAMSAKTLRWRRAGESIKAGPQFSCRQVEGLRDVPRRLSLSLHSHSCLSNHSVARSYSITLPGSHRPPGKALNLTDCGPLLPTACSLGAVCARASAKCLVHGFSLNPHSNPVTQGLWLAHIHG